MTRDVLKPRKDWTFDKASQMLLKFQHVFIVEIQTNHYFKLLEISPFDLPTINKRKPYVCGYNRNEVTKSH